MKPRPPLPGGPYLVLGLARSGRAAALALRGRGEEVIGCDAGEPEVDDLRESGVEVHLGQAGDALLPRARAVVKSPGVPASAPAVAGARDRGVALMGELELAWRLLPNEFIAVTGTNGKTTTTELLGHIHNQAGRAATVAGNVGTAVTSLVNRLEPEAVLVCECSSFQLEDTIEFAPEAAVLLNLAEDHLDRHGDLDRYVAAKLQAFARQGPADLAVAPRELGALELGGQARRLSFGAGPGAHLAQRGGQLIWGERAFMAVSEIRLRGAHNLLNAMAAAAVALGRGIDASAVRAALSSFPGVAHRLEEVAEHLGVHYLNDSKATNVASTLVALRSFPGASVHLIAGGQGKDQAFEGLREAAALACAGIYLIGEDAPRIARALEGAGPPITQCGDLERAVSVARGVARAGQVVLLSPACASFDQYADFEARGEHFRDLATALPDSS